MMDTQLESRAGRGRSRTWSVVLAVVLIGALSSGIVYFVVAGETTGAFDPVATAELAPADTHFFVAVNTDFASEPWRAVPRLLDAMEIEQQVRDDVRDSFEEDGLDYDEEVFPAIATVRRFAVAVQYDSTGAEVVGVIDSREPERVLALLARLQDDATASTERDEDLGLDFDVYSTPRESGEPSLTVITLHDGLIYLGESTGHVSSFIYRQRSQSPLGESERFRAAMSDVAEGALVVGYGSGGILDHRDFRDIVDGLIETAEVDPRDGTFAFSVTARSTGWGLRSVLRLDSGFGAAESLTAAPADLRSMTSYTPEDALLFWAGSGLRDAFEELYSQAERDAPELLEFFIEPWEELTGISVERELVPLLGNSYGIAFGGEDIGGRDFAPDQLWVLGLVESTDPARLADHASAVREEFEFSCECETGVDIGHRGRYMLLRWPDAQPSNGRLADSTAFQHTRSLLPAEPALLLFVNLSALAPDLIDEWSAELAGRDGSYEVNLDAILGFALAVSGDETSIEFDMVLPIATAEAE